MAAPHQANARSNFFSCTSCYLAGRDEQRRRAPGSPGLAPYPPGSRPYPPGSRPYPPGSRPYPPGSRPYPPGDLRGSGPRPFRTHPATSVDQGRGLSVPTRRPPWIKAAAFPYPPGDLRGSRPRPFRTHPATRKTHPIARLAAVRWRHSQRKTSTCPHKAPATHTGRINVYGA